MLKYILIILAVAVVWLIALLIINRGFNASVSNLKISNIKVGGADISAEVADNFLSRMRGLSGRESLGENKGMLFIFDNPGVQSFWMKDMNFPIDIIWLDNDSIVGFAENAPAPNGLNIPSFRSPSAVNRVLELNAGSVKKLNLKIGDRVVYGS